MDNTKTIKLKWKKNFYNRWETYYKGCVIEVDTNGAFRVNGWKTLNINLRTVINFIDDGCYSELR